MFYPSRPIHHVCIGKSLFRNPFCHNSLDHVEILLFQKISTIWLLLHGKIEETMQNLPSYIGSPKDLPNKWVIKFSNSLSKIPRHDIFTYSDKSRIPRWKSNIWSNIFQFLLWVCSGALLGKHKELYFTEAHAALQ